MTTLIQSILKKSELDYTTFTDSVSKFRVSTPESLIDTDFEYGLQSIKWETLQLVNNIPTFFSRSGDTPIPMSNVYTYTGQRYVYVNTVGPHNLMEGAPFYISGLKSPTAEGYFTLAKRLSPSNFVYQAKYQQTVSGTLYIKDCSYLFPGMVYQGTSFSAEQLSWIETDSLSPSTLSVGFRSPHDFVPKTMFTLANSFGLREISLNSGFSGAAIPLLNHNLYTGMNITFSFSSGSFQTDGGVQALNSTYIVEVVNKDNFRLIPTGSSIAFTSYNVTAVIKFTTTDSASDGSDYEVSTVPNSTSVNLLATSQILARTYTLVANKAVVQNQTNNTTYANTITFDTRHGLLTGAQISANDLAEIGLAAGQDYFVIYVGPSTIALATSRANAFAGIRMTFSPGTSLSTTSKTFVSKSVIGEEFGPGTLNTVSGSTTLTGSNLNFLSYFKPGMRIRIFINAATPTSYSIISTTGTAVNLNTAISATAVTSFPLRYVGTTVGSFVNNGVYYANATAGQTSGITFTSQTQTPSAHLTATGISGTFQTITAATIYEATITQVINSTTITVNVAPTFTANGSSYYIQSALYPFSDSYVYHRAFDGGIEMNPSNNANAQLVRQTRKYFRYQPGKGIQSSLSVNFSAPIEIDYLSRSGLVATGRTRKPHRLTVGLSITISGATQSAWNGVFTVTSVNVNTFTFNLTGAPANAELFAGGYPKFKVNSWSGSRLRAGLYDDHNGMFFEYDGTSAYAVRRDSVIQISGAANVWYGSNEVIATSGTNTSFLTQVTLGQNIVIRGHTYRVVNIPSNSNLFIQPTYRGVSEENCIISLVTDTRQPQSQWSIDKCDGTGPTGYVLDINKIQMIYMDYSWYGAGKIRFGFKDNKGVVRYVHEFQHNNIQDTAYFRSGNLPGRYEVYNVGAPTWVPPLLHWGTAVIMDGRYDDDKSYLFTANGNIINYTNGDTITISASVANQNPLLVYDPYQQRSILGYQIISAGVEGSINSWTKLQNLKSGTFIQRTANLQISQTIGTPQKENSDPAKAIIYTTTQLPPFPVGGTTSFVFGQNNDLIPGIIPLVSIRVAPSVDSSLTGALGVRELVNHMQLRLRSIDILTTNDTELRIYLNSFISNRNFITASPPSLSQYVAHNKGDTIQDGTILFSYRVPGGIIDSAGKRTSTVTSYDISGLGFLGNSIQGGDSVYPDGPDILTIAAVCLDPGGVTATTPYTVSSRVTWAEAQA